MNELQKVEDYLKQVTYFSVATVDGDKLKCRPLAFHLFLNGHLYFGVGTFKDVYKQLEENPNLEICACNGENFLRYYGKAVFEKDNTIADMVLSKVPAMQKIYNSQTGYQLGIFHLEHATAEFRTKLGIAEKFEFEIG